MSAQDRLPRPELAPGDNGLLHSRLILILLLADVLIVPLALGLAFLLRVSIPFPWTQHLLPFDRIHLLQSSLLLALVTQLPLLFFSGLYEATFLRRSKESVLAILLMVGFQLLLISAWFFFSGGIQFPRSVLLLFSFFNFLFLVGVRWAAGRVLRSGRRFLSGSLNLTSGCQLVIDGVLLGSTLWCSAVSCRLSDAFLRSKTAFSACSAVSRSIASRARSAKVGMRKESKYFLTCLKMSERMQS